jgi:UDP-N-acetylmuramate dehydrogenase
MLIEFNVPLSTTLQLPCTGRCCYTVESVADFPVLTLALGTAPHTPYKVLGGGSNVLCATQSVGAVVRIAIKGVHLLRTEDDAYIVQVGAGEGWHDTVQRTLAQGWAGLENLALIPGWVGAAPVQNIGAYGVELCDRLHSVQAWDAQLGEMVDIAAADCGFAYRDSVFKQSAGRYLIASVTFKLPRPWQAVITYAELAKQFGADRVESHLEVTPQAIADAVIATRQRKLPDPSQIANAGSFFKNPVVSSEQAAALKALHPTLPVYPQSLGRSKLAAGWLIEQAGWKGYTRRTDSGGQVGVHVAQALVLVHLGGAQGAELLQLASDIQADVLSKFGVQLAREVNVW